MQLRRKADSREQRELKSATNSVSLGAPERAGGVPAAAEAARDTPALSCAWDPYEVWLTRVKQPRDLSAQRRTQADVSESSSRASSPDNAEAEATLAPALSR